MTTYPIRLGYACISTDLREYDVFTSRSLIIKTALSKGTEYIKQLITDNIKDLFTMIIYNEAHGIRFFRISSGIFPHLGNPLLAGSDYDITFAKDILKKIGLYAKNHGHRLTMHPGQFVQLGSNNPEVVVRSRVDLENHANLLKMLGYGPEDSSVLIIHGGGTFGDKTATLARWRENFLNLPKNIRDLISLENDENGYSVMDLLPFCEELKIPFCLDIFHNRVSKDRVVITKKLMRRIFNTWKIRGMIPKIHYSEQQPGLRRGAHSKTIDELPEYLFRLPEMLKTPFDIMLEVKDKENSVFKMYHKYFNIKMDKQGIINYEKKLKF
ncbi:putative UV-damage endonuclease [Cotonvirus japonicus]|uniref:UV-damage endonuclease n=1 Tax=Cotonvirus japonicus TaxID=2811091 RepID=A0ABM7NRT8_9VIRU|nr:putative UV-damage endonuclease [Cotonvirus japonicus]BCS82868.1 putative UV-damage endonuclease [Cotonvirus japonicus]